MGGKRIRELLAGTHVFQINNKRERKDFHAAAQAAGFHTRTFDKIYVQRAIKRCNSCGLLTKKIKIIPQFCRRETKISMSTKTFYKTMEYAKIEASRLPLEGCKCARCAKQSEITQ